MASSEKASNITGRQYVAAAKVDLAFADLAVAGEFTITDLPEGSVVTGGWIYTDDAFDATATMTVVTEDVDGNTLETLSGALAVSGVGKDDLVPTGVAISARGEVKITTNINLTQGSGFLYIEYITDGRQNFSEG